MSEEAKHEDDSPPLPSEYYAMVVDSGPIIKQDVRNLMGKAVTYVTTPSVLREIRDSKARDYLEHSVVPLLELQTREPSDSSMQEIIAFAKQTGDYASLSTVDLQVLALTLDLEKEGCMHLVRNNNKNNNNLGHIRTTPKRKIGLGSITPMNANTDSNKKPSEATQSVPDALQEEKTKDDEAAEAAEKVDQPSTSTSNSTSSNPPLEEKPFDLQDYDEVEDSDEDEYEDDNINNNTNAENDEGTVELTAKLSEMRLKRKANNATTTTNIQTKSWATLVNPTAAVAAAAASLMPTTTNSTTPVVVAAAVVPLAKGKSFSESGGQFDDASEDDDETKDESRHELGEEFPSLLAASTVPYEGEDDEIAAKEDREESQTSKDVDGGVTVNVDANVDRNPHHKTRASVFMTEEEKQQNLKPISKSGRNYNSFRKYKGLMKPKQPKKKKSESIEDDDDDDDEAPQLIYDKTATSITEPQGTRFLSGGGGGETMAEEDDDGVGWITSSDDIKVLKNEAGGVLDPGKTGALGDGTNNSNNNNLNTKKASGPHLSQRCACATTDFAMQNVLLQMNLILLSTEGMRIRRLKTWVMRCGACFKIHLPDEDFEDETHHHMKRLFCKHCGSDMMQRISASVDGKTGRLKLHFSKRKQGRHHSIRGTKFALPKPGSNNKYKGDLLLREDQLLSGAWNQKVKINSGRKYQTAKSQSMFGRDIASSVGCNVRSTSSATFGGKGWASASNTSSGGFGTNSDDIKVGFGARKNPNAARGRERRGKKKKSSDRACGMRRY